MEIKMVMEEGADLPAYATDGSVGFDLVAHNFNKILKGSKEVSLGKKMLNSISKGFVYLRPFERLVVFTGIKSLQLPEGYHLEIRSRSGLALKKGLLVANQPGTIDPDYRGPIKVILFNSTPYLNKVVLGMRIAQGVVVPYVKPDLLAVENVELSTTERGEGGFGSTGD